ncbi:MULTISPECIES: hypothetical protein [unclassified Lysobacter]|uniref:hypothetical protein n=1 Tax=unclassified Lysobacter TaxID=2635362 RepID=UPI001BE7BAED|nr:MULTISPECIES: hypothetical protein [unclassified Lysobacter]MBT2746063.1 hypothetical protein [Lysobacter sp. ISL-42]MBT2752498.1 hypothetical protein [Lysobacter sp. ISL-50]MBT2776773.1 hypothetical protein [Lysobacter sp. ISL-54]MBT2780659.1 hypothetical protein [Lysobacter sp. ISL-52]
MMQLTTDFRAEYLPGIVARFDSWIDRAEWMRVVKNVRKEIKGNSFLESYLAELHRTPLALEKIKNIISRFGHGAIHAHMSGAEYETIVLMVQFVDVVQRLDNKKARSLAGRMNGALRNPADMRALQFELQVATHLVKRDFEVEFPETDGKGIFDILATRGGRTAPLEFECKFITADKGRYVSQREALEINSLLEKALKKYIGGLRVGLVLRVIFKDRPPKNIVDRLELCSHVKEVIVLGADYQCADYSIRLSQLDLKNSIFSSGEFSEEDLTLFLKGHGIVNKQVMVLGVKGKGVVVISLESEKPNKFLSRVFETISDAAKRQLTGTHPGCICVKFDDLNESQLVEIGLERDTPTALRAAASRFLSSSASSNVAVLAFYADGELTTLQGGGITRGGRTYHFPRDLRMFENNDALKRAFQD